MNRYISAAVGCIVAALLAGCAPESGQSSAVKESELGIELGERAAANAPIAAVLTVAEVDSDGENVSASGFLTAPSGAGARCVFRFERGETQVVRETMPRSNHGAPSCGLVSVPLTELERGTWTVTLSATSTDVDVLIDRQFLEVP